MVRRPGPRHRCEPSGQQPDALEHGPKLPPDRSQANADALGEILQPNARLARGKPVVPIIQPDARLARGKLGRYHESLAEGNPLDGVDLRRYLGELGMDLGAFEGLDDNALAEVCRAIENWRGENLDDSDEDVSAEEDGPRGGGNRAVTFSVNVTQGKRAGATPPGTEEAR